jgi:hypothetical protein
VIKNVGERKRKAKPDGNKERRAFYGLSKPCLRVRQKRKKRKRLCADKGVVMPCAKCKYLQSLSDGGKEQP